MQSSAPPTKKSGKSRATLFLGVALTTAILGALLWPQVRSVRSILANESTKEGRTRGQQSHRTAKERMGLHRNRTVEPSLTDQAFRERLLDLDNKHIQDRIEKLDRQHTIEADWRSAPDTAISNLNDFISATEDQEHLEGLRESAAEQMLAIENGEH